MPRRKWIDKKNATTFSLVHRPQNDPLIHDESAPQMVLNPTTSGTKPKYTSGTNKDKAKAKDLNDLTSELGSDTLSVIRDNEGEAAAYGVYYDDTEYDYMQHMRDLNGSGPGQVFFLEAPTPNDKKGKGKKKLEVALRDMDLKDAGGSGSVLDKDILPSQGLQPLSYQAQQDVPDAIAGFQPDMDPRVREVLEALEDEAYVDDDEDIFQALAKDTEVPEHVFEDGAFDDEADDGWESDRTEKAIEYRGEEQDEVPELTSATNHTGSGIPAPPSQESDDWTTEFEKFKQDKAAGNFKPAPFPSELESKQTSLSFLAGGKRKKRKGALTNPSTFSMSSASLPRTEHQRLLDDRFQKLWEREYQPKFGGDRSDVASTKASRVSTVQGPMPINFNQIMEEYLQSDTRPSRRGFKNTKKQTGLEQLDEIRRELGPARLSSRQQK